MAGKWWEAAPVVEEQQAPQQRGGVFIPDQGAIDDASRAETSLGLQVQGNERANQQFGNEVDTRARQGMGDIRKEFTALPEVKKYGTVVQQADTILHTRPDAAGDQDLIYAIAQLRDPLGSVREGDAATIEGGQAAIERTVQQLKKQLGQGGTFSDEYRQQLRREAISRLNTANRAYSQARNQYAEIAQASGFDPKLVIGPHAGAAYYDRFKAYDDAQAPQEPQGGMGRGPIPGATMDNITFDMDTGQGAFGSQLQADRLTAAQQNALDAFLKANAGNPNFGPDQLGSFYRSIGVEGALPASPAFFEAVKSGKPFDTTPDPSAADAEIKRRAMEASYSEIPQGGDVSAAGRDKGLLLNMTDELRGVVGGIGDTFKGGSFAQGYQRERDIERALQERSRQGNGVWPELVGGLMTPAGVLSRANMARDAAAMGAIAGFGEGEGATDSLGKAATGAGLGYGAAKGIEAAAPIVANSAIGQKAKSFFASAPDTAAQDFAAAAERQGLDYLPADIPGATKTQFATSVSKATLGGIPLADAAKKIVAKARSARDRIAGGVGEVADNTGAGQAAQRGMEAWKAATGDRGGELYDAIPIKPDTKVDLSTTRQTLADLNSSISSNDELAALVRDPRMAAYQRALEKGDLSWNDIKQFRSYIGEKAGRPTLQQDTSKDSLDALYGALSSDIERAAAAHSPEAAKAFSRANSYWRGRQTRINDVMARLVGKDGNMSPEATFAQIERWAGQKGGDFSSLARTIRSLPEDEANSIRATIIDRLGNKVAGDEGTFSTDAFLTQWSKLSDRGKAVLFQGEHRKALDDLATVFEGSKFSRGFDNNSKTGLINTALSSGAVGLVDPVSGLAFAALQYGGGKLLSSPRVARWLVALSKKPNPSAQLAHIGQLAAIARAEPIIANDIFTLQQRLADAFAQPQSLRAAAEENDKVGDQKVGEGERDGPQ